jgi:hypothetical protein
MVRSKSRPASKEGTLRFRAPDALIEAVENVAAREMTTASAIIRQLVISGLRTTHGVDPAAPAQPKAA